MALNTIVAAGNGGVSGPSKAEVEADADKVLLPMATVSGDLANNNFTANKKTAIRHSVAKTNSTATASSEVYSETCGLRFAYATAEGGTHPSADTGVYANGTQVPRT